LLGWGSRPTSKREVILVLAIVNLVRDRWLASSFKAPHEFVFGNTQGGSLDYRDVGEHFRDTIKRASTRAPGEKLTLHSLRHGFASLLISQGLNVVFVSRQPGHANPNITLGVYAHLYARADHAETARAALELRGDGGGRQVARSATKRAPRGAPRYPYPIRAGR
jgi:integrase